MSQKEYERRIYHAEVRKFKQWCTENKIAYYTLNDAPSDSICAISMDEYAVNTRRCMLDEDYESLFINDECFLMIERLPAQLKPRVMKNTPELPKLVLDLPE